MDAFDWNQVGRRDDVVHANQYYPAVLQYGLRGSAAMICSYLVQLFSGTIGVVIRPPNNVCLLWHLSACDSKVI
jgi:hypothetical protein